MLTGLNAVIVPCPVNGRLTPPASKSVMQRICAAALLHEGTTLIRNPGCSEDELAALRIIATLGAEVTAEQDLIHIKSRGLNPLQHTLHCGESGLSARIFTFIAALWNAPMQIEGSGSLTGRDMSPFSEILLALSVSMPGFKGSIPFTIQGPLRPSGMHIDGSGGSQYLTGLLIALAFRADHKLKLSVSNLKSKPYTDLTLQILQHFGRPVSHTGYREFEIDPAAFFPVPEPVTLTPERDWSSAAALLVAGATAGSVSLSGMDMNSAQADRAVLEALSRAGARISIRDNSLKVSKMPLQAFDFDATDCPDLFPVLSVLAASASGHSTIHGTGRLANKESNRAQSILHMMEQLGVSCRISGDTLHIEGAPGLRGGTLSGSNDHRMVMAAAIAGLRADAPVAIEGWQAVYKSYPGFFRDLQILSGQQHTIPETH